MAMTLRLTKEEEQELESLKAIFGHSTASKTLKHIISTHQELRVKLASETSKKVDALEELDQIHDEVKQYFTAETALKKRLTEKEETKKDRPIRYIPREERVGICNG